jgi:hypothetical protein
MEGTWRTVEKGYSSNFWVGRGANSDSKKTTLLRKLGKSLGLGRVLWTNDMDIIFAI